MSEQAHQAFAFRHVMIACAPNGARRTHRDHAALPMTPGEIAAQAARLPDVGVSMLHLHVRDEDGQHSLSPDRYEQAIAAVRKEVGSELVIQITTEAVGRYSAEEQMAVVRELRPEAASLALAELCPDEASELQAGQFFESLQPNGTWPQYILYTPDHLRLTMCGSSPGLRARRSRSTNRWIRRVIPNWAISWSRPDCPILTSCFFERVFHAR